MKAKRKGQAIVVIFMIALILGLMMGGASTFFRGQVHLLSKSAKDYLALCAAETGINCILAEMKANPQFVTHGNAYIPQPGWSSPAKHRPFLVGNMEGLELDHPARGTYTGKIYMKRTRTYAQFKVRIKLLSAKNSLDTKTIEETHRFFQMEAVGKVDDTVRKITAIIEKYSPAAYLKYDGQILDLGADGPYPITPGQLKRGRIYGHDGIRISKRGLLDAGVEFLETEKISTPGHLKIGNNTFINLRNGRDEHLKSGADSFGDPDSFQTFPEKSGNRIVGQFVLDGYHGAKPEKFPALNPRYYKDAADPKPIMLSAGCGYDGFSESRWKNPGKPGEVVYDLNFGSEFKSNDDKKLFYSSVPLRVWGNPPFKSTTIFCEKDVYIAGDFNANPDNPQNYDMAYRDYTDQPENGTDKNGAQILSMGRIWFDYSNPMLFLRNEMRTLLDYEIGMRLGGKDLTPLVMAPIVFPHRFSTGSDPRLPMTALNFKVISNLFVLPKEPPQVIPLTLAGIAVSGDLKELRDFLDPSSDPSVYRERFCIKSFLMRQTACEKIGAACYMLGFLTKGERDWVINSILDEAEKEVNESELDQSLGPWNVADRLSKLAITHPKLGFRMPEMTVNALLIDSGELNAKWDTGLMGTDKVLNEIGNIRSTEARCFPYVNASETRMILRHMGGMMHLRTLPATPFLDGKLRSDGFIIRRNVWDKTFVQGGGDYYPRYVPAAFALVSWQDDIIPADQFESFD